MQMGSLCVVLPGCSLTDYFVPSRLVKRRVVKSRSGMNRDAAFFISGTSGWRCCNNSVVKNTYHCSSPITGTINVFLRRCPWAGLADVMGVGQPRTPPCISSASSAPRLGRARRNFPSWHKSHLRVVAGRLFEFPGIRHIWHKGACSELKCYPHCACTTNR